VDAVVSGARGAGSSVLVAEKKAMELTSNTIATTPPKKIKIGFMAFYSTLPMTQIKGEQNAAESSAAITITTS